MQNSATVCKILFCFVFTIILLLFKTIKYLLKLIKCFNRSKIILKIVFHTRGSSGAR
jgi:hypothetical protein